jgi:hypothetical protein
MQAVLLNLIHRCEGKPYCFNVVVAIEVRTGNLLDLLSFQNPEHLVYPCTQLQQFGGLLPYPTKHQDHKEFPAS